MSAPTKKLRPLQPRLSRRIGHGPTRTMKEAKRTPVPLPGSKTKSTAKVTPPKASLSNEFIGSDDDSAPNNAPQPKEKPKTTIAVHRPNGVVKSKPGAKASTLIPALRAKAAPKKAAPKQLTQVQADELFSSDDDATVRDTQTKPPGINKENGHAASDSDSDSDSGSESSSDESDANRAQQALQRPVQPRPPQAQPHAVEFWPAQAYTPPKGFNLVPWNDKTTSKSARMFENLEGKQIWHITAPAGVSLSELKEIAMDQVMNGEAILQHKGTSYGFSRVEQSYDGACEVMVPKQDGYKAGTLCRTSSEHHD
jgi:hypothetical protein